MDEKFRIKIEQRLKKIYGYLPGNEIFKDLLNTVKFTKTRLKPSLAEKWNEKDIVLITYGDSIKSNNELPLVTLKNFLDTHLKDQVTYLHILPFFPYSSDDGFSVIDYLEVNPELGTWTEIEELNLNFKLMTDLVINHISQHSKWFQNYLKGEDPGKDYFIEVDPETDLSMVVRPRSLPLLTKVKAANGYKYVWTTFSADQIDLNFSNPKVLVEMIRVFLFYVEKGARIIRLDAIAFLWKKISTNCLHLPETHEVVKLMRDIVEYVDNTIVLLTETNVPNKENLSYFGAGDEANMVYQFSLPPLLLHGLFMGSTSYITRWASELPQLPDNCTFFNFTASHDGIGVRPLEGLIPILELSELVDGMKSFGGLISTKRNVDGSNTPYELNITYYDALTDTKSGKDSLQDKRFLCSQIVMLSMKGVPAIYIHSLLATKNYTEGVKETGMNRTINRRKWDYDVLSGLLEDNTSYHSAIFNELRRIIKIRKKIQAFHPNTHQQILIVADEVFAFIRGHKVLVIANFTNKEVTIRKEQIKQLKENHNDLLSQKIVSLNHSSLNLEPYQVVWLDLS